MTSEIAASIRRALRPGSTPEQDQVHLHIGGDGRPFVCDLHRCDSPALTLRDVGA